MSGVDGLKDLLNKAKTVEKWVHSEYDKSWDCCCSCGEGTACQDNTVTCPFQDVEILTKQDVVEFFKDKVVVDRKQLSDLMKQQPFPEAFKWITDFKSQYQHWTKKLKELLEDKVVFEDPK